MCGIVGFSTIKGSNAHISDCSSAKVILTGMSDAIAHRGPDDSGAMVDDKNDSYITGLAHRRLSIIDLSQGHQPLHNEDGTLQIVYNGEVYNYQSLRTELRQMGYAFKTSSDTEVVLQAYAAFGSACVEKLRGMFSFAIWHSDTQQLFLARDRYGKKPLFYTCGAEGIVFASEIKAILAYNRSDQLSINKAGIVSYMRYRYVPSPETLFTDVYKLPPGCHATWQEGILNIQRYYTPPDQKKRDQHRQNTSEKKVIDGFLAVLKEAVHIRMVSDVPFGSFLSGGLDSSAIVALMSQYSSQPINTFSVGFTESRYSELGYAKTIAEQFSTNHHELEISDKILMDTLPKLIAYRDAPIAEPSDIPIYLLSCEAAKSVKMVLTGEGSDEVLGGYPKHAYERFASSYQVLPRIMRNSWMPAFMQRLPYRFRRVKTAVANLGCEDWVERMPRWFGALNEEELRELLQPSLHPYLHHHSVDAYHFQCQRDNTSLRNILYFDQTSWLPDNLLERGDRMTMAASIESRMPFMDHQLIAYVSALPDHFRIRGLQGKWLLRQAINSIIPQTIIDRPKVGFRVPVNEWFQHGMRDYLCDHLLAQTACIAPYFQHHVLERYVHEHIKGHHNHEKLLWTLLNLELWHQQKVND